MRIISLWAATTTTPLSRTSLNDSNDRAVERAMSERYLALRS